MPAVDIDEWSRASGGASRSSWGESVVAGVDLVNESPNPVLVTDRLTLRPHVAADLDACAAMWADPAVVRHIGGAPSSREQSWHRILRYGGLWRLLGYGYWSLRERASGRFVGEAGFAEFGREITPAVDAPEAGWALASWAHGQGYAAEAMRAILAWGDRNLPVARTVCLIGPDNEPSIRLALKLGYRETARTSYKGGDSILFERVRPA